MIKALILTICSGKGVLVLISSHTLAMQEAHETKTIAKLRIHVERAICRIKEFHIFDSDISLSTLGTVNQMFTVACLLTNCDPPCKNTFYERLDFSETGFQRVYKGFQRAFKGFLKGRLLKGF